MDQEIPRSNVQIHTCVIEHVYDSGLIDARSERGRLFERISLCINGVEGAFALGDQCIVLTDGSQHFAFGTSRPIRSTDQGESIRSFDPGFMDWDNTRAISAEDSFGNSARVYVSAGGGVILDTGELCVAHYSPGTAKLLQYLERKEVVMPSHHSDIDHDGETAEAEYIWQTRPDEDAMERRMKKEDDPSKHTDGHTLNVGIRDDSDGIVQVGLYKEGGEVLDITLHEDGSWTVGSDGRVSIKADESVDIVSEKSGQITIENKSGDIYEIPSGELRMGHRTNVEKVVVEQKLKDEITRKVRQIFNTHTHPYIPPLVPMPTASPTSPPSSPMMGLGDIQSKNVKANAEPNP